MNSPNRHTDTIHASRHTAEDAAAASVQAYEEYWKSKMGDQSLVAEEVSTASAGEFQETNRQASRHIGARAVQYRTEHSRNLNDKEKYQALEELRRLGVLVPLTDIDTYHGRADIQSNTMPWQVNPYFKNGSNDSGNNNVFTTPSIYTSNREVASDFASARKMGLYIQHTVGGMMNWLYASDEEKQKHREKVDSVVSKEIHEIVTNDTDATIIRQNFSYDALSDEDKIAYRHSMSQLVEHIPVSEDQKQLGLPRLLEKGEATLWQMAASMQSRHNSSAGPEVKEYIEHFFRETHIVGWESTVISATLDGKAIDIVALFDLQKVGTPEQYEEQRRHLEKSLAPIGSALEKDVAHINESPLKDMITSPYVRPQEILAAAKRVPGFDAIFEADGGNWEGYTLEEHTETVLRNFDENFADKVPVELLAPLRLAILVHDIGKSEAVMHNQKHLQQTYNDREANKFLQVIGTPSEMNECILGLIGKGVHLASGPAVRGNDASLPELRQFAKAELQKIINDGVSETTVDGYLDMCEILVTCDGGAYTEMATTRGTKDNVIRRNFKSFDDSFIAPAGLGRHDLRLKHSGIAERSRQM